MGLKTSLRMVLDGFGLKGRLVFHALFWRSGRGPASLMWSRSELMTITVARFGSATLSRELLPIPCLVQKMFPHHVFITTVIFPTNHKVSSLCRTTGRPSWLIHNSSVRPSLSLSLSPSVYIQMSRSRGELASEISLHTTPFRLQISQDIQCTRKFINT